MSVYLIIISAFLLLGAYRVYGRFLEKRCGIDPERLTPACEINDSVDYVPTRVSVLFGHHFSSIAGAGPIVGPIIAASLFGWLPTWMWIMVGSIFVGGVHDFGSTLMSLRYRGQSITATCRDLIGETPGKLFLIFILLALVYVIVVFLDLTVVGFVEQPAVATASGWFIFMAILFGWFSGRSTLPFKVVMPAYTTFRPQDWSYLAPILFITVACGACSGFHSIVSSGTTSKQIRTEQDVRPVSYGAMRKVVMLELYWYLYCLRLQPFQNLRDQMVLSCRSGRQFGLYLAQRINCSQHWL